MCTYDIKLMNAFGCLSTRINLKKEFKIFINNFTIIKNKWTIGEQITKTFRDFNATNHVKKDFFTLISIES